MPKYKFCKRCGEEASTGVTITIPLLGVSVWPDPVDAGGNAWLCLDCHHQLRSMVRDWWWKVEQRSKDLGGM